MKTTTTILTLAVAMLCAAGCDDPKIETGKTSTPQLPEIELPFETKGNPLPFEPHLASIRKGRKYLDDNKITNYTALFGKQENLGGMTGLKKPEQMKVRFREKPFSIAMAWTVNAGLADRMLYVAGRWKDRQGRDLMLVRPKGAVAQFLAGKSLLRRPDGPDAMKSALRPCTKFGLRNTIADLERVYKAATAKKECHEFFLGQTVHGNDKTPCYVIARLLPNKRPEYPAKTTYIFLDRKTFLPLRIIGYDWNDKLQCDYQYLSIKFNAGLTDAHFTPAACKIEPPKIKK